MELLTPTLFLKQLTPTMYTYLEYVKTQVVLHKYDIAVGVKFENDGSSKEDSSRESILEGLHAVMSPPPHTHTLLCHISLNMPSHPTLIRV